jgi:membrane protein DedA with SNARE-associated domain
VLEYCIDILRHLPTAGILAFVCFVMFLENVFPPSPSDMILVFCGTLVSLSGVGFVPMVIAATTGSILGFAVMYWVGARFGVGIQQGNVKFLPRAAILQAEHWFQRYGLWIIVANRFLSGTRAVISLFAGMSELPFSQTMALSGVSAAVWNAILIGAGTALGHNWMHVEEYLTLYGQIAAALVLSAIGFIIFKSVRSRNEASNRSGGKDSVASPLSNGRTSQTSTQTPHEASREEAREEARKEPHQELTTSPQDTHSPHS